MHLGGVPGGAGVVHVGVGGVGMEITQNLRDYITRGHRLETLIAELTVWLRDGYTAPADIDTVSPDAMPCARVAGGDTGAT